MMPIHNIPDAESVLRHKLCSTSLQHDVYSANSLANSTPNADSVLQHRLRNTSSQHVIHPAQSVPQNAPNNVANAQ